MPDFLTAFALADRLKVPVTRADCLEDVEQEWVTAAAILIEAKNLYDEATEKKR